MQLVVNTFGACIRRKGDRFVVRAGSEQMAVSAQKVQTILVATAVRLSSDVIARAVSHNIDVVFLDKSGDPMARDGNGTHAWTTVIHSNNDRDKAHHESHESHESHEKESL
jgi:CRISPR-associated protein Cas1